MKVLLGLLVVLSVASCTHKNTPSEERTPASALVVRDQHLSPEEIQGLSEILKERDAKRFKGLLRATRITQSLAASFDDRLFALQNKAESDQLMSSSLYCKVLSLRAVQERVDEKALQVFEFTQGRPQDRAWLLQEMTTYAEESVLNEAAMIQLFRTIRPHEQTICGSENCLEKELQAYKFRVSPFDDQAFADFVKAHRKDIAKYSKPRSYDLNPGACFGESRTPQQASSYDWKNRNWVGSVLPEGSFAITYDDGPSALYTRAIRDVWANAGMAKPSFFWLTKEALKNKDIVRELDAQGYIIGSHSYGHPDIGNLARSNSIENFNAQNKHYFDSELSSIGDFQSWKRQQLYKEIPGAAEQLGAITGKKIRYFRLPYGSGVKNDIVANYFQQMNVEHFFWRVDSMDWQDKNPVSVRDRVITQMNTVKKGIVLFHDIHPQSLKAAELLVQYFRNNPQFRAVPLNAIPGLER